MNCRECIAPKHVCPSCRKMRKEGDWLYGIDNGTRYCKCPECGRRNSIHSYQYKNPFIYCFHCGRKNIHGEQTEIDITPD